MFCMSCVTKVREMDGKRRNEMATLLSEHGTDKWNSRFRNSVVTPATHLLFLSHRCTSLCLSTSEPDPKTRSSLIKENGRRAFLITRSTPRPLGGYWQYNSINELMVLDVDVLPLYVPESRSCAMLDALFLLRVHLSSLALSLVCLPSAAATALALGLFACVWWERES